ncbi:MAG: type I DNA topoisomerase, partial [bacterium]
MPEKKTPKKTARSPKKKTSSATKSANKKTPSAAKGAKSGPKGGGSRKLVIVESPTKVRTIQKILGGEYTIIASKGHVRDLLKTGERKMGIDVNNGFRADYGEIATKKKTIDDLRKAARGAEEIYLAPDPDREGEAIAWHIQEILREGKERGKIFRVAFNEITPRAVREALSRPGRIDQRKVDAQETRRKLDRIVGFKLSGEILWNKVAFGLSAGRVQSVALRLICEREEEIEAFEPREYWTIAVTLEKAGSGRPFEARLHRIADEEAEIPTEEEARRLAALIEAARLGVGKIERRERRRRPPAPFITSTLQQEGSTKLRFGAKRTMRIAQGLYEGINVGGEQGTVGLITYMRTDSTRLAPEAVDMARAYVGERFGKDFLPDSPPRHKKGEMAQDAHEAIRPTDVSLTPERLASVLKPDQLSLYTLIWRRFLASQMTPAVFDQTSVDIPAGDLLLRASGSVLKFSGFLEVYQEREKGESEEGAAPGRDRLLPPLEEGDPLERIATEAAPTGVLPEQHFTQPPPRYTEASLVKTLEEDGVGRPSTYASILDTLERRKYVEMERRKRQLTPNSLGREVSKLLVEGFPEEMDVKFTAKMEGALDEIERGSTPWLPVLSEFYDQFDRKVQAAKKSLPNLKTKTEPLGRDCPLCGKPLVKKFSRNGWFGSCSGYPECRHAESLAPEGGNGEPDEDLARIEEQAAPCAECGEPMQARRGPYGLYLVCSAQPKEHKTRKVNPDGREAAPPVPTGIACGRKGCDGEIVQRRARRTGKPFYGCNRFPQCKYVVWDRPIEKPCPACGHPHITVKVYKKKAPQLVCPLKECDFAEEAPAALLASLPLLSDAAEAAGKAASAGDAP